MRLRLQRLWISSDSRERPVGVPHVAGIIKGNLCHPLIFPRPFTLILFLLSTTCLPPSPSTPPFTLLSIFCTCEYRSSNSYPSFPSNHCHRHRAMLNWFPPSEHLSLFLQLGLLLSPTPKCIGLACLYYSTRPMQVRDNDFRRPRCALTCIATTQLPPFNFLSLLSPQEMLTN